MTDRLLTLVRLLLGAVCFLNGLNWFWKIITPYPSMSDFVDFLPPPDIVGALIDNGILFHLAKAVEVVTGLALLFNRFVPLALVVGMSVTVTVFVVDVFKPEFRLRAFLMGTGTMAMSVTLLIAYLDHYRPMLAYKANPNPDPAQPRPADGGAVADVTGRIAKPFLVPLAVVSALVGLVQVGWLLVMVGQYAADPKAIHEVRQMVPRP
jgi:hypothetical protein